MGLISIKQTKISRQCSKRDGFGGIMNKQNTVATGKGKKFHKNQGKSSLEETKILVLISRAWEGYLGK